MSIQNSYIEYLHHPELLNQNTLQEIELLVDKYPYFGILQTLYACNLYVLGAPNSEEQLYQAALYQTNRSKLHELVARIDKYKTKNRLNHEKEPNNPISPESKEGINSSNGTPRNGNNLLDVVFDQLEDQSHTLDNNGNFKPNIGLNIEKEYAADLIPIIKSDSDQKLTQGPNIEDEPLGWYSFRIKNSVLTAKDLLELEYTTNSTAQDILSEQSQILKRSLEEISFDPITPNNSDIHELSKEYQFYDIEKELQPDIVAAPKHDLIEKFIERSYTFTPPTITEETTTEDISLESVSESEHLITDTLAQIYIRQGYYHKAINAYKKLSLNYPEKNSYFAAQIKNIEQLINSKI